MPWQPNPARDANGHVLPHDDPELIPDQYTLLRHVHPERWTTDENTGLPRPHSNEFTFSTTGSKSMSVDIEPPMLEAGLSPTHYAFLAGKGVVRLTAAKARELQLRVGSEPIPGNDHHGGMWPPAAGLGSSGERRMRQALSRNSEFIARAPDGASNP